MARNKAKKERSIRGSKQTLKGDCAPKERPSLQGDNDNESLDGGPGRMYMIEDTVKNMIARGRQSPLTPRLLLIAKENNKGACSFGFIILVFSFTFKLLLLISMVFISLFKIYGKTAV